MPERGDVIHGFEIQGVLRSGPRGVVYEAMQGSLLRPVALRVLDPQLSRDPDFVERFRRQRWPEHPHIVSVFEAGECEDGLFLAMQLITGETLAELLARDALAGPAALAALTEVAGALDAAHEDGLAHGWVRPEAVLIDASRRAWLSDFGLTPGKATPSGDLDAFRALVRTCLGRASLPRGRWDTASELIAAAAAARRGPGDQGDGGWRRLARRVLPPRR